MAGKFARRGAFWFF